MKFHSMIGKNLKLLFRSKETAFMIIFGPLLIILLVSAAYIGGSNNIAIGTYAPTYTSGVNKLISSFEKKDYVVSTFNSQEECVSKIRRGIIQACIIFPDDFKPDASESQKIIFKVDTSRMNFVYMLIQDIGSELNIQSTDISQDLTAKILVALSSSKKVVDEQYEAAKRMDSSRQLASEKLSSINSTINGVNFNITIPDLKTLKGHINGLDQISLEIKKTGLSGIEEGLDTLYTIQDSVLENDTEKLVDDAIGSLLNLTDVLEQDYLEVPKKIQEANSIIEDSAVAVSKVNDKLLEIKDNNALVEANLKEATIKLDSLKQDLTTLLGQLQYLENQYDGIRGLDAEGVSKPIITKIEPINNANSKLSFTFPYLMLLVIMFLGLMISSSLVVMDKTTKAAFRLFTTATRDEYFVAMSFITTMLILFIQTIVVLIIGGLFLQETLFNNFGVSITILLIAMAIFSFIGMIIGYLTKTQEASMISSLTIGTILLFISNLVLPLETMNKVVQGLTAYNPFVVLSEMLRQSMLFSMPLSGVYVKLGIMFLGIVILLLVVLIVQKSFKSSFFKGKPGDLDAKAFASVTDKDIKPLIIKNKEIKDVFGLLDSLDSLTRADFHELIKTKEKAVKINSIYDWVLKELGEKKLAKKLKTNSKERMILALEKYVKKKTKKLSKKM